MTVLTEDLLQWLLADDKVDSYQGTDHVTVGRFVVAGKVWPTGWSCPTLFPS